jgi:hypothetical protein
MVEFRAEYVLCFEMFALQIESTPYSGMKQILLQHCNFFVGFLLYDLVIMPGRRCQPAVMFPSLKLDVDFVRAANDMAAGTASELICGTRMTLCKIT